MDASFFRVGLVTESIAQSAADGPERVKRWPMSWDFSTDPEYAEQLKWVEAFVREECEPLDLIIEESHDLNDPVRQALIPPLQQVVKERGLWATHLGAHLGGPGYGQMKLALLNEILGRSECAPIVFGSQAPDSGNSEILAHYGTPELKARYLEPLLDNRIVSCFSMTEPQGGADPKVFTTAAVQDGDEWVINGEKWFSSFADMAAFLIVMAVTDPDAPPYERHSMFVVPRETPGINILRNVGLGYEPRGGGREGYVSYEDVRVPADHMLGPRGGAFVVAQTRLGGGRIHHAMRTVGLVRRIFDMLCERAVSRYTQGEMLGNKQMVQEMIADSWMEIESFRLLTLQTAWKIDQYNDYKAVRADISAVKAMMQKVLHDVSARALQLHGSLGVTHEMPFVEYLVESFVLGLADGPTEVHKVALARQVLKRYQPAADLFPSEHLLRLRAEAEAKVADRLRGIPRA
jgi:alkylation response protein AidB-like acyl-CoA dehydrogenase